MSIFFPESWEVSDRSIYRQTLFPSVISKVVEFIIYG